MPAVITITLNDNGSTSINGPFDNKLLMLGMLETGKEAYLDWARAKAAGTDKKIIEATIIPPADLKKLD